MDFRRVAVGMAAVVGLLSLAWWATGGDEAHSRVNEAPRATEPAAPAPAPAQAPSQPRTVLHKPAPPTPKPSLGVPAPPVAPVDEVQIISKDQVETVMADTFRAEVIRPVQRCLQITAPPEDFDGELSFDLQFDEQGLQEAAIDDLTGLPEGLVDCVADAVWSARWARLDEGEASVLWPILVSLEH